MKTIEEQIKELITAIEKKEGDIASLEAKLTTLIRRNIKKDGGTITSESAQGGAQLLQE
jgi:hypothetical protein